MSWITDDWKLKLLALALSVLTLGAVAFSQTPTTQKTFNPLIDYKVPGNLVIINPPLKVPVRVTGLADTITTMTDSSVTATVDLSKASPGQAVKLNMTLGTQGVGSSVSVINSTVPITLNIDKRQTVSLTVDAILPRPAPDWLVTKTTVSCGDSVTTCIVNYDGPVQWETNLKAVATLTKPIATTETVQLGVQIVLLQNNLALPETLTYLPSGLDQSTVSIKVDAKTGSTSTTLPLVAAAPSRPPPSGYRVTGITINPVSVIATGDQTVLSHTSFITLPAVDLSSSTSNATFKVNIPSLSGVTLSAQTASITYTITPIPSPSP